MRSTRVIANVPQWAINVSAARTPVTMPGAFDVYVAWAFTDTQGGEQVRVSRSRDNGENWVVSYQRADALMPHVEAGPNSRVHLTLLADDDEMDVLTVRSLDSGDTWENTVHDLTAGDGALQHTAPVIAVSNDASVPGVWVVYDYEFQDPVWGSERDLRFAYSRDGGATWTLDRRLSSDRGVDEWIPDMAGARGAPNRWVNLAFNYDPHLANAYQRNVIWRYTSGGLPNLLGAAADRQRPQRGRALRRRAGHRLLARRHRARERRGLRRRQPEQRVLLCPVARPTPRRGRAGQRGRRGPGPGRICRNPSPSPSR